MPWFWSLDIYTWSERGKSQGFNICPSFASSFSDALGSGLEPRSVLQILLFLLSDAMKHTVNMYVRVGWNKLKFFAVCCEKKQHSCSPIGSHLSSNSSNFEANSWKISWTHGKSHTIFWQIICWWNMAKNKNNFEQLWFQWVWLEFQVRFNT